MLYRRGHVYWVAFKSRGRRYRLSTGAKDRRAAVVEARRLQSQYSREDAHPRKRKGASPHLLACGARDVREAEDQGGSPGHIGSIESMWRALCAALGELTPLHRVDLGALLAYEGSRRQSGIRGQTIRKELRCLRRAFLRAKRDGIDVEIPDPWPKIRSSAPHPTRTGRLVPPKVLRDVLKGLPVDLRDELVVAALTGLREAELHRLESSWVEREGRGYVLRVPAEAAKTRKGRVVSLPPAGREILKRRGKVIPAGPLFPRNRWQRRRTLRRAALNAGLVGPITLRDLRTTYGSLALKGSGDAAAVQASMGHSDLRTTQKYQRSTIQRTQAAGTAVARALRLGDTGRGHTAKRKAS